MGMGASPKNIFTWKIPLGESRRPLHVRLPPIPRSFFPRLPPVSFKVRRVSNYLLLQRLQLNYTRNL